MIPSQLRASQLVMTFGPGAMLDLPEHSVIVGGLEGWHYPRDFVPTIDEPRLLLKVQQILEQGDLTLRAPPTRSDAPHQVSRSDVVVWRFPLWFTVQDVARSGGARKRRLVHFSELEGEKFRDAEGGKHPVVPVRFVRACNNGHVGDLDWRVYSHGPGAECIRPMHLEERGTTGDIGEILVACECGRERKLFEAAFRELKVLGRCDGARPWLGPKSREHCEEYSRLLVRTASNAHFSQLISAISIPPQGHVLDEFVAAQMQVLRGTLEAPAVLETLRMLPPFADALRGHDDATVLASIRRMLDQGDRQSPPIKDAEFEALSQAADELGSDEAHGRFYARALPAGRWKQPWMQGVRRVVLVHRLREVVALVGFTRFESASVDIDGELDVAVERAPLARDLSTVKWVPAVENRGEGIFIEFDPAAIEAWLKRAAVVARAQTLLSGFGVWLAEHEGSKRTFPGVQYVMLHSLAHLLITTLSLDCGYAASSLRERIYALQPAGSGAARYGILIYTGSSDAEGTLGGLVSAGRTIADRLRSALQLGLLCSNDPVCAYHDPAQHGHSPLLGAACHGCLLVSETSCEMRNDLLDRALVVPTVEALGSHFFESFS